MSDHNQQTEDEDQTPTYCFTDASETIIGSEEGEEIHAEGGVDVVMRKGGDSDWSSVTRATTPSGAARTRSWSSRGRP